MAGQTWDMITSGPEAGTLIHPLTYTTDEDQATRVEVYLWLATPEGEYLLNTTEGLAHERILLPETTDQEREQLVVELVLDHPRVAEVDTVEVVTSDDGASVTITASFFTITGQEIGIGATI